MPTGRDEEQRRVIELVVEAWRAAANDLGISVITPYRVPEIDHCQASASLPDFGGRRGMLLFLRGAGAVDGEITLADAQAAGYFVSVLYPEGYRRYDREGWIATLNDWGYYGDPATTPEWYTGAPWSP